MSKKLISTYSYQVEGLDHTIEGRITDLGEKFPSRYQWILSHYCSQQPDMGVYIPTRDMESSIEAAQSRMEQYIQKFTTYNVTENPVF